MAERTTRWQRGSTPGRLAFAAGDRTYQPFFPRQDLGLRPDPRSEDLLPESPIRTETFYAYAPGAGAFAPSKLAPIIEGRPAEELKNVGSHSHNDFDEVYYFFGMDWTDNTRLGGQVEMWLGHGDDAEKFVMKDPTAVYVPKDWPTTRGSSPR